MKKYLKGFCVLMIMCTALLNSNVEAEQIEKHKEERVVYIAGNPDFYPLEYYNHNKHCFEGLLPNFYAHLSQESGLSFKYINANGKDNQVQLAENLQAEIISAHIKDSIANLSNDTELFTYDSKGKKLTVAIGVTAIADAELVTILNNAINGADKDAWLRYTMDLAESHNIYSNLFKYSLLGMLIIIALVVTICIFKIKKCKKELKCSIMIDQPTGMGNYKYFKYGFEKFISREMRPLYYIVLIGFDAEKLEKYLGIKEIKNIQNYIAKVINNSLKEDSFAAHIESGIFAVAYMASNTQTVDDFVKIILKQLNSYQKNILSDVEITFSIGVYSLALEDEFETALDNAKKGYNFAVNHHQEYCFCNDEILKKEAFKARLQAGLSEAINNNEIELYLQFVVDAKTNGICGAEALSRWHNHEEGMISPSHYIEEMEKAGLIDKLDFYIFDKVCQKLQEWENTEYAYLNISCNFTRITISEKDFVSRLKQIINKYNFDHSKLILELTEDSFEANNIVSRQNIEACKKMNFKIALDDLGIGYTSFIDIYNYPIDIIKIDKNIIDKSLNERGFKILGAIINFSHELGIKVLCEGVETAEFETICKKANCDYIQGFYYSHVFPENEAIIYHDKYQKRGK